MEAVTRQSAFGVHASTALGEVRSAASFGLADGERRRQRIVEAVVGAPVLLPDTDGQAQFGREPDGVLQDRRALVSVLPRDEAARAPRPPAIQSVVL